MTHGTYADLVRPSRKRDAQLYSLILIIGGSLLIGLCAQIAIPLPFSPVPITAQSFAVLLAGITLGSKRGSLCLLTYLCEGLVGLPVFAGGNSGIVYALGPTGGYLLGFLAAAYLTGLLAERGWDRRLRSNLLAMLLGNVAIYALGLPWLAVFVGVEKVLALGLLPYIPGDLIKIGIAGALLPVAWQFTRHRPAD
jgi:biotin transport system substrate-specific component